MALCAQRQPDQLPPRLSAKLKMRLMVGPLPQTNDRKLMGTTMSRASNIVICITRVSRSCLNFTLWHRPHPLVLLAP